MPLRCATSQREGPKKRLHHLRARSRVSRRRSADGDRGRMGVAYRSYSAPAKIPISFKETGRAQLSSSAPHTNPSSTEASTHSVGDSPSDCGNPFLALPRIPASTQPLAHRPKKPRWRARGYNRRTKTWPPNQLPHLTTHQPYQPALSSPLSTTPYHCAARTQCATSFPPLSCHSLAPAASSIPTMIPSTAFSPLNLVPNCLSPPTTPCLPGSLMAPSILLPLTPL